MSAGDADVLVVEADPETAERTARRLTDVAGTTFSTVASGPEGALSRLDDVDCVVVGHDPDGIDGVEFARTVRRRSNVGVVLFPREGSESLASAAVTAGLDDYVSRGPDGPDEPYRDLADRVDRAVRRRRGRRDRQAAAARFGALAENVSDAVVVIDADSRIQYANPAVERVFGYEPTELRGESLTRVMPERFRDRHLSALQSYLLEDEQSVDWTGVEFPGLHREGHEVPLSISFGEFEHDGKQFFAGVIRRTDD